MILKLRSGDTVVLAQAWSAGANSEEDQVFITAHGGTIGLTLSMREFQRLLGKPGKIVDLSAWCEDPHVTMTRLAMCPVPKT